MSEDRTAPVDDCFVVAIDGPAGAGKSTVARAVAARLGYGYVDSGALYRAAALAALRANVSIDDAQAVADQINVAKIFLSDDSNSVQLGGEEVSGAIRTPEVSQAASKVSALPAVRTALIDLQRRAARPPGIVADGRDIGTVIFPDAQLKVFLDADPGERAKRRTDELSAAGKSAKLDQVRKEMDERDARDRNREVAPLRPAEDAVIVDSTSMGIDEVVALIVNEIDARFRT
jgi:cytidylate kinase